MFGNDGSAYTHLFIFFHLIVLTLCFSEQQMRRLGNTREIGLACLYLATDATFCTGMDLLCTGGAEIGFGVKMEGQAL